jgi:CIC family chloride channel protein
VENIYTIKLVGRGHFVPKAMHASMLLVRRAGDVMERDVIVMPADRRSRRIPAPARRLAGLQACHIVGVVRINAGIFRGIEAVYSGVTMGAIAQRNFTAARENDIVFDIVQRMSRRDATMAIVMKTGGRGRPSEIVGIIFKEHIADSVADSIKPFG